jgi:hypothetical protein
MEVIVFWDLSKSNTQISLQFSLKGLSRFDIEIGNN